MQTVTKKDLMELENYGEYEAKRIIQEAKVKLVERNFEFYAIQNWGEFQRILLKKF